MTCSPADFIAHIKQDNHLNRIFRDYDIPVSIKYHDPQTTGDLLKTFFGGTDQCAHTLDLDDDIPLVVHDMEKDKMVAVLILKAYPKCMYIAYQCVHQKYRGQGWGSFLTFMAVFFAKACAFHFVFSMGVSGMKTPAGYQRTGGYNDIDISQQMNIKTFGFEDFYSAETYTIARMKHFGSYCGEFAETALDLNLGNLVAYEIYKQDIVHNPRKKFAVFLDTKSARKTKKPN